MAFGVLGVSPAEFWKLTPRDIHLVSRALGLADGTTLNRLELDQLMQRYPDHRTEQQEDQHG